MNAQFTEVIDLTNEDSDDELEEVLQFTKHKFPGKAITITKRTKGLNINENNGGGLDEKTLQLLKDKHPGQTIETIMTNEKVNAVIKSLNSDINCNATAYNPEDSDFYKFVFNCKPDTHKIMEHFLRNKN